MKTFLEHTRDQQEEGIGDSIKKGVQSAGSAIKKKVMGDGKKKEKGPGMMDKIKAGAKKVVQAVGREFEKGRQSAGAPKAAENVTLENVKSSKSTKDVAPVVTAWFCKTRPVVV